VGSTTSPFGWDPHPAVWAVLALGTLAVAAGHRRLMRRAERPNPWTRRQIGLYSGACATTLVAMTWPLGELAAHWSLTALVTQRLILVLTVAPLLLMGLPYDLVQWLTRPAAVDAVLTRLQRPPLAIATVTVVLVGSMTPALVRLQSASALARGLLAALIVVAGLVLWVPVLGRIPGILRLKPVVRFGYLVVQAVVPAFLSFIYIFAVHPLYPAFARSHAAIGLRPLNDQQMAGFVSKLTMLLVLLSVGGVVLAHASTTDDELGPNDPLVWADVERQFERADRQGLKRSEGSEATEVAGGAAPGLDRSEHPSPSGDPLEGDPPDGP
jgi:cytochrome c oxidase assembly factor CtaG